MTNHVVKNDGIFFMPFEQFVSLYTHTFVSYSRDNYVHSIFTTYEEKCAVMFKITNPTKGHISGYVLTRRVGTQIDHDYKVQPLILKLYKYDKVNKKDLVLEEEKKSNIIGHVHIPIDLEPGIYVLEAQYEIPTKVPYISIVGYTDVSINFIELKLKDFGEINLAKIKEAIKQNKPTYKPKTSNKKLAGAFRTCLNGHELKHAAKGNKFICENCRNTGAAEDGRWGCLECNYEICLKCRPPARKTLDKTKSTEVMKCNDGHEMTFGTSPDDSLFLCDSCGKAYYGSVARWKCETCGSDFCRTCLPPPKGFKPKDEILEIDECFNDHPLEFLVAETDNGMYECSLCGKLGDTHNGRWACLDCGVNICHICKPSGKFKPGTLSAKTKTLVCSKGHMLLFSCKPPAKGCAIACDKCRGKITGEYWRWSCEECHFDVCTKCRPEPKGRRDLLCPNMHKMES